MSKVHIAFSGDTLQLKQLQCLTRTLQLALEQESNWLLMMGKNTLELSLAMRKTKGPG